MPEIWLMIEWKLALLAFVVAAVVRTGQGGSTSSSDDSGPTGSNSRSASADPVATYKPSALADVSLQIPLKLAVLMTLAGVMVALLFMEP